MVLCLCQARMDLSTVYWQGKCPGFSGSTARPMRKKLRTVLAEHGMHPATWELGSEICLGLSKRVSSSSCRLHTEAVKCSCWQHSLCRRVVCGWSSMGNKMCCACIALQLSMTCFHTAAGMTTSSFYINFLLDPMKASDKDTLVWTCTRYRSAILKYMRFVGEFRKDRHAGLLGDSLVLKDLNMWNHSAYLSDSYSVKHTSCPSWNFF